MNIVQPSFQIMKYDKQALSFLEKIGRICYKSEDKIKKGSAEKFIENIIHRDHTAMVEHSSITVKFIHNRGFSHELVRHRLSSFAQESTRYVDYNKDKYKKELTFIAPYWEKGEFLKKEQMQANILHAYDLWYGTMWEIEKTYKEMKDLGTDTDAVRGILPNDIKTEIVITANFREWRKILSLRTAKVAHPDMRRVMIPLLQELKKNIPVIFNDINTGE